MASAKHFAQFAAVTLIGVGTGTAIFKPALDDLEKRKFDRVEIARPAEQSNTSLNSQNDTATGFQNQTADAEAPTKSPSLWNVLGGWAWSEQARQEVRTAPRSNSLEANGRKNIKEQ